jgi:hypothetical protein
MAPTHTREGWSELSKCSSGFWFSLLPDVVNSSIVVPTRSGYMSPEYAMDGIFSVKSDVFSFGVLVLEIVSGRKNRGMYGSAEQTSLLSHVSRSIHLIMCSYSYTFDICT